MAKRKAFVHIGLPHSGGGFLDSALALHEQALERAGVRRPMRKPDEMFRAAVEIRRDHRAWGYDRRDVEGTWSTICRRAYKAKGTVVFSERLLAGATSPEIDLLLDRLSGFEAHVVVTLAAGQSDAAVIARWTAALRRPEHLHVITAPAMGDRAESMWGDFGRVVGFDATTLPLSGLVAPGPVRLAAAS